MRVLDVGCGTGAITSGIARAVGPAGQVVGVDRDASLLEIARREHPHIRFEEGDAAGLTFDREIDIVTAARTLQWISEPGVAVLRMKEAAKPGGFVVALDYNHEANEWEPSPPTEFLTFYRAFLSWRVAHGWDNAMADHLPALFAAAGLIEVETLNADDVSVRGESRFPEQAAIWPYVIETLGEKVVHEGFLSAVQLADALAAAERWSGAELRRQILTMRTVIGRRPG
jgi:SAM-dependent methyltransferase